MVSQINGNRNLLCGPCGTTRGDCRVRGIIGADRYADAATWDEAHLRAERALDPQICLGCGRTSTLLTGARCGNCQKPVRRPP